MMKTKYIIIAIVFLCFYSCKEGVKDISVISIQGENKLGEYDYFKIFDKAEIIPLETSKNSVIGFINKIVSVDSLYYILDIRSKQVLCFNNKGKFIQKIGKKGLGPGEYISPFDLFIDNKDSCIKIIDNQKKVMLSFSLLGDFIGELKMPCFCKNVIEINDGYLLFIGTAPYDRGSNNKGLKFVKIDYEGNVLCEIYGSVNVVHDLWSPISHITKGGEIYYMESFDYTLHSIDDCTIADVFRFNFGNKTFPNDIVAKLNGMEPREVAFNLQECDYVVGIQNIFQNQNIFIFNYLLNKKSHFIIVDKNSKSVLVEFPAFIKDKERWNTFFYPIVLNEKEIVEVVMPSNIFYLRDQRTNSENRQKQLDSICSNLTIDSNPVIVKHHLKEVFKVRKK